MMKRPMMPPKNTLMPPAAKPPVKKAKKPKAKKPVAPKGK